MVVSMGVITNSKRLQSVRRIYISLQGQCWKAVLRLVPLIEHCRLRVYIVCRNKVAQWNHWDCFTLPCCTTLLSHQKTSLFLSQRHHKSRTENSNITCATSHDKPTSKPKIS